MWRPLPALSSAACWRETDSSSMTMSHVCMRPMTTRGCRGSGMVRTPAGGADHEPRLARALAHGFDVCGLVELRSAAGSIAVVHFAAGPAVLVCAARPESFFFPSDTDGASETPHTTSPPSLQTSSFKRLEAGVVADVVAADGVDRADVVGRHGGRLREHLHVAAFGALRIAALLLGRAAAEEDEREGENG